jgi:hypothetical protein
VLQELMHKVWSDLSRTNERSHLKSQHTRVAASPGTSIVFPPILATRVETTPWIFLTAGAQSM